MKVVCSRFEISAFRSLFFRSKKCNDLVASDSEIRMKYIREIYGQNAQLLLLYHNYIFVPLC